MTIIVDAAPLVAAADRTDRLHASAAGVLESTDEAIVISPFVMAEVDYFLSDRLGLRLQTEFLRNVASSAIGIQRFEAADIARCVDIIEQYGDMHVGLADASNVVLAERHGTTRILTFDERHFRVMRAAGGRPFTILPADA